MFMDTFQILFLFLLSSFYSIYLAKMIILKFQNIQGNILGKEDKPKKAHAIEVILKITTYLGAMVQFISVLFLKQSWFVSRIWQFREIGIILGVMGNLFFLLSVVTMKENWRAGFSSKQNTELVTQGIYRISRNPAFVGFDLLYIGCALTFPNIIHLVIAVLVVILFHIQILGEEKYLLMVFKESYKQYQKCVKRYIGRKKFVE